MAPNNIRVELSENYFRKWEHLIRDAVLAYPSGVRFDWVSLGLKHITIMSRLRDAIRSFRQYSWQTAWFDSKNPMHVAALALIEVRSDPHSESHIMIAPPSAFKVTRPMNVQSEFVNSAVESLMVPNRSQNLMPSLSPEEKKPEGLIHEFTSYDNLRTVLLSYCELIKFVSNPPKLHITTPVPSFIESVRIIIGEFESLYDIAFHETADYIIVF